MSAYLEKLLPILIYPLGLTLFLCIAAFILSFGRRVRVLRVSIAVAVILLWLASTQSFANLLTNTSRRTESIGPDRSDFAERRCHSLGRPQRSANPSGAHWRPRDAKTAFLWRAGKAQTIIVSGGKLPWDPGSGQTEAKSVAELLHAYGVPSDAIIVESDSRDTHHNAVNTAALWRERHFRSGLLVTSATHMPRALATFRKVGLDLTPWPADFRGTYPLVNSIFDFLPDVYALEKTTTAIKEWLGLAIYRLRGWA